MGGRLSLIMFSFTLVGTRVFPWDLRSNGVFWSHLYLNAPSFKILFGQASRRQSCTACAPLALLQDTSSSTSPTMTPPDLKQSRWELPAIQAPSNILRAKLLLELVAPVWMALFLSKSNLREPVEFINLLGLLAHLWRKCAITPHGEKRWWWLYFIVRSQLDVTAAPFPATQEAKFLTEQNQRLSIFSNPLVWSRFQTPRLLLFGLLYILVMDLTPFMWLYFFFLLNFKSFSHYSLTLSHLASPSDLSHLVESNSLTLLEWNCNLICPFGN